MNLRRLMSVCVPLLLAMGLLLGGCQKKEEAAEHPAEKKEAAAEHPQQQPAATDTAKAAQPAQ
jgi:hypothetical protein